MLNLFPRTLQDLTNDRRGVTALEYGLLAGLIAVALIGVLGTFSTDVQNLFTNVSSKVVTATPAG